jgi:hypothetical protein
VEAVHELKVAVLQDQVSLQELVHRLHP